MPQPRGRAAPPLCSASHQVHELGRIDLALLDKPLGHANDFGPVILQKLAPAQSGYAAC
jgi:hypothetical protein